MQRSHSGSKIRKIIGDILTAMVIVLMVYLSFIMFQRIAASSRKGTVSFYYVLEMTVCLFLLLLSLDVRSGFLAKNEKLRIPGWIARIIVTALTLLVIFFGAKATAGSMISNAGKADHVIVLGMALENGKPSKDLQSRIDTAYRYYEEHPDAKLILAGGNPDPETGMSEAAVMKQLLKEKGVHDVNMMIEDHSSYTVENFRNTAAMINPHEPVVIVSSNYHMDRAVRMAEVAGFTDIMRLPAPSDALYFGANVMWEVTADIIGLFIF